MKTFRKVMSLIVIGVAACPSMACVLCAVQSTGK